MHEIPEHFDFEADDSLIEVTTDPRDVARFPNLREPHPILGEGLSFKHIQERLCLWMGSKKISERHFIDEFASGPVNDDDVGL